MFFWPNQICIWHNSLLNNKLVDFLMVIETRVTGKETHHELWSNSFIDTLLRIRSKKEPCGTKHVDATNKC